MDYLGQDFGLTSEYDSMSVDAIVAELFVLRICGHEKVLPGKESKRGPSFHAFKAPQQAG